MYGEDLCTVNHVKLLSPPRTHTPHLLPLWIFHWPFEGSGSDVVRFVMFLWRQAAESFVVFHGFTSALFCLYCDHMELVFLSPVYLCDTILRLDAREGLSSLNVGALKLVPPLSTKVCDNW